MIGKYLLNCVKSSDFGRASFMHVGRSIGLDQRFEMLLAYTGFQLVLWHIAILF